jgi:hypothetical protein
MRHRWEDRIKVDKKSMTVQTGFNVFQTDLMGCCEEEIEPLGFMKTRNFLIN